MSRPNFAERPPEPLIRNSAGQASGAATLKLAELPPEPLIQRIILIDLALLLALLVGAGAVTLHGGIASLADAAALLDRVFALSDSQVFWFITRAAGMTAYMLLWLSTAWGLAVSSHIFDGALRRAFAYEFHEFLSLLGLVFTFVHIGSLMLDRYLPFSLADALVPFADSYRPLWVGVGIIAFYLSALVSVTFYIRRWIGTRTFRAIHYASFLAYAGATLHGLMAGTDGALPSARILYAATGLSIVFLTVYRVLLAGRAATPQAQIP